MVEFSFESYLPSSLTYVGIQEATGEDNTKGNVRNPEREEEEGVF